MTESEFLTLTDALLTHIQDEIETQSDVFDCAYDGNVLSIEHEDGDTIIINRHIATQELWIAAKSGGYHFVFQNQQWFSSRENADFDTILNRVIQAASGEDWRIQTHS